jgi:hypothetical protein
MSYTDLAAQARSYASTAAAATRRAERDAREAEKFYRTAAGMRRRAARLTQDPQLWHPESLHTPAQYEAQAASWTKTADVYLRSSWRATASAEFYRGLAARYRAMAARQAATLATP